MRRRMDRMLLAAGVSVLVACSATEAATETTAPREAPGPDTDRIEVTYFTPVQTEGPYYPVNKPKDRDNDLVDLEGSDGSPAGEILEFGGRLFDASGMPVAGAVVEIWQTDNNGVYLHPNDPGTSRRDPHFQFYGESVTADDGSYRFRTIVPGHYRPRPRHIHVKVRMDGRELLTTQFYFADDPHLASDSVLGRATADQSALSMHLYEGTGTDLGPARIGNRDIVLQSRLSQP